MEIVNLGKLFKDYQESQAFRSLVNLSETVGENAFITKSGDLLAAIAYRGPDPECAEHDFLTGVVAACQSALRVFDERFRVNTFQLRRSCPAFDFKTFQSRVVNEAVKNRHDLLFGKRRSLYSTESFLTVTITPEWKSPRFLDRVAALSRDPLRFLRRNNDGRVQSFDLELSASLKTLQYAMKSFVEQTADCLDARILTTAEAFAVFRRILNLDPVKASAVALTHDFDVDFQLVDSELECYRDHLRLDNYFVKPLTLKQLPGRTFANIFSQLGRVNADLIISTEWSARDPLKAVSDIRSKRRHANNTKVSLFSQLGSERPYERELLFDESKEAIVADLGECLKSIEMRGVKLGEFGLTVLVIADSLEGAERGAAEVMKVVGTRDGALNEERYNGLNTFLAALPAGHPYNLRKHLVTNENHADMVGWFQPAEGERINRFLNAGYLVAFETEDQSLYHYNFHVQDVGHTAIVAPTGSGKSFLVNFLITHAQQYDPYTFIFDVGASYRWLVEILGGAYVPMRSELRSFLINPLSLEPTPENLEFLFAFFKLLIESDGHRMTDGEERELFEAIRSIYMLDAEHRRLMTLSTTVPRSVGVHLKRWTEGEQYGEWFDHVDDTVTFARCQCFDFEGMERLGIVREPLMFYMLHRANQIIYDPSLATVFKLGVFDEARLFFKHPTTQAYITDAGSRWRKKNAAMILSTQSIRDFAGDEVYRPLLESCPTKILLANPTLDAALHADVLRLNAVEIEKVRALVPKKQFLLKRDGFSKVLNLNVDPKSYWLFTTNPFEATRRQELVNKFGLEAALNILAGEPK